MGDVGHSVRRKNLAKKSGLPRRVKDMSKEQLQATLQKKRECNAKAMTIVEQMLEVNIYEDWFLQQLKFIDVGHFQDIIEERALSKLCGYPLCAENLKSTPNQQFRISTKYNKVYDITERKNFCSNQCYKASKYVKDQLLTSPLWLRDKDDVPAFKLLPLESQGTGAGEEVDFGQNSELKSEVNRLNNDEKFISVADYTQDSISQLSKKISDMEINEKSEIVNSDAIVSKSAGQNLESELENKAKTQCAPCHGGRSTQVLKEKTDAENVNETIQNKEKIKQNCYGDHGTINLKEESSKEKVVDEGNKSACENSEHEKIKNPKENENKQSKSIKTEECPEVTSSIIHVEKCLHEWFTIETMCFIFGDEKVKELVNDKGECIKEYYKAVGKSLWDPVIQERYEALCRKLSIMEIKEQQLEKEDLQLKPLPDYSTLKEENLKMEIKIQAFYQGKPDYEIPVSVEKEEEKKESFTPSCVLPLVDIHAQNALRRRMVLDNLKRVLPDLLRTFGLSSRDISSEVRCLVGSFRLSAHNITFSPPEWNLLGLIIIKMLSIKDMRLKMVLESQQGIKYQTMLLMTFQQDGGYLDRLMVWLTDMDNIMKKP